MNGCVCEVIVRANNAMDPSDGDVLESRLVYNRCNLRRDSDTTFV
jgi:hypothetical protein